jgi:predicted nucleic acid-binding protein
MDISDLPYPDLSQFEQYGTGRRARKVYIGREFLKFRYHENPTDDTTVTKQNYVDEFFELVVEIETPFREIHITQSTLTEVTIWLQRNQSEAVANQCLTETLGDSPLTVQPTTNAVFRTAMEDFVDDTDKDPNFGEYLDYATMQERERERDIEHILTWDSDFSRFNDTVTMLPHKM